MPKKFLSKPVGTLLVGFFIAITALSVRGEESFAQDSAVKDVTFSISGVFSIGQLQILRALMAEAEKFALSEEAVGAKEPTVTRFADKQEQAFLVDVEKLGNQSRLFVTISSEIGRMTADAGRINRSVRREEGFFFDLLSRLQSELPKLPEKSAK